MVQEIILVKTKLKLITKGKKVSLGTMYNVVSHRGYGYINSS